MPRKQIQVMIAIHRTAAMMIAALDPPSSLKPNSLNV